MEHRDMARMFMAALAEAVEEHRRGVRTGERAKATPVRAQTNAPKPDQQRASTEWSIGWAQGLGQATAHRSQRTRHQVEGRLAPASPDQAAAARGPSRTQTMRTTTPGTARAYAQPPPELPLSQE
jgi:hypothetical protein